MGDATSNGAGWSPDSKRVVYCAKGDLFVANADGADPHKLVSMPGSALGNPVWSPDGSHLRFSAKADSSPDSLWEVSADGTNLHQLLPGWGKEAEFVGGWTTSRKYFLFESRGQIWALARNRRFLGREPTPIQLTSSPMRLGSPVPSQDGKEIFVVGRTPRAEVVRYDWKSGQYSPFLGGVSAEYIAFSKDEQWVAYVAYPEGTLWRSKVDGGERMQLTSPPGYVINPRWSPDGKTIVFSPESTPGGPAKMYEVSRDGGTPRPLLPDDPLPQVDPNWSPEGRKIVFGGDSINAPDRGVTSAIRVLDLDTHQVTTLPGSDKLFAPRWSPDGRYIVAQSTDGKTLQRFDLQTQQWMELVKGKGVGWANWSKDGKSLYVIAGADIGIAVLRLQVAGGQVERVSDLKNFAGTGHWDVVSLSLAPDDSGLLLRDASTSDVYALDWEEP
jgi:Tol biopolymer transport system component